MLGGRLVNSDAAAMPGKNVVLTGGASQMTGLVDMAARNLGRPSRIGSPPSVEGLPASMTSPAFSAVIGMACTPPVAATQLNQALPSRVSGGGYLDRMEQWLRESF